MKQRCRMLLAAGVVLLVLAAGCAQRGYDPFQSYFFSRPFADFLTAEDTAALRECWPRAFALLEETLGPVTLLNGEAMAEVQCLAIERGEPGFGEIIDEGFALAFDRAAERFNAEQAAQAEHALPRLLRAHPDQLEVRNRKTATRISLPGAQGRRGRQCRFRRASDPIRDRRL